MIAGLPMDGLRLAVLTESGGMSGLVHAFHLAGCPDVVATLWNVDDDAAAAVIKLFFQGVWRKGLGPLAALRRAQLWPTATRVGSRSWRGWRARRSRWP